jgi:hypothetical protein
MIQDLALSIGSSKSLLDSSAGAAMISAASALAGAVIGTAGGAIANYWLQRRQFELKQVEGAAKVLATDQVRARVILIKLDASINQGNRRRVE